MIKYQCYEPSCEGIYTLEELKDMWDKEIDTSNFEDFESWVEEMLECMVLRII